MRIGIAQDGLENDGGHNRPDREAAQQGDCALAAKADRRPLEQHGKNRDLE
jgi:hypothetical protein